MKIIAALFVISTMAGFAGTAAATNPTRIVLDFENIIPEPRIVQGNHDIANFYNGGISDYGTSGINYGVTFSGGATPICLSTKTSPCTNGSHGGLGEPSSAYTGLGFVYGDSSTGTINVKNGFVGTFSFDYTAPVVDQTLTIWSGANGTGNQLATMHLALTANGLGVPTCGSGNRYCPFVDASLAFDGVARSVTVTGASRYIVMDDISFIARPIPEPESYAMLLAGLALMGTVSRRKNLARRTGPQSGS
jgi:hypothetical protein